MEASCKAARLQELSVTLAHDEVAGPVSTLLVNHLHQQSRTVGSNGSSGGGSTGGGEGKGKKGKKRRDAASKSKSKSGARGRLGGGASAAQGLSSLALVHSSSLSKPFWFSVGTVVASLTSVDLSSNMLGLHGALALARALTRRCRAVPGSGDGERDGESPATNLVSLALRRNSIGCLGAAAIADSLLGCRTLTSLDLGTNDIGAELGHGVNLGQREHCVDRLRELLTRCESLVSIDLSGNELPVSFYFSFVRMMIEFFVNIMILLNEYIFSATVVGLLHVVVVPDDAAVGGREREGHARCSWLQRRDGGGRRGVRARDGRVGGRACDQSVVAVLAC